MNFEQQRQVEKLGKVIGYASAYVVCTSALFMILYFSGKMPAGWNYLNVMAITSLVALSGQILYRQLK